jgi:hypothetical protein
VKTSNSRASFDAIIAGRADAAFSSTVSPSPKKLAASPRGLYWPPLPHDDEAGWKRVMAAAPVYNKVRATIGWEIDKANPPQLSNFPYPILITNAAKDSDEVYALVKAMVDHHADYKDAAKGAKGWNLDAQMMKWAMPYHDGAIRAWKELGKWSVEAQAHNDKLIARQGILKTAWDALADKDSLEADVLKAAWSKARSQALKKAGFNSVFR